MKPSIHIESASPVSSINNKTQSTILNLIATNNDRYESYLKSVKETNDPMLKDLFTRLSIQSQVFNNELRSLIPFINAEHESSLATNLHRACMYIRSSVLMNDTCRVISTCEYGEIMAINNYENALADATLSADITRTLTEQLAHLKRVVKELQFLNGFACA